MKLVKDPNQLLQDTVESWLKGLMHHMAEANAADKRVKQRRTELRGLYSTLDESQLRNKIKVDWDLHDALDKYHTHCLEVQRYHDAITALTTGQAFLAKLVNRVIQSPVGFDE